MAATYEAIRYTFCDGDLLTDGTPTRKAVDRLAEQTCAAIAAEFPGAEVTVHVERRVSGLESKIHFYPDPEDWKQESSDREGVRYLAGKCWEEWCQKLTEADYVQEEP